MTRLISFAMLVAVLPLGGCAYLTNYTRPVDLRAGSISIDVKQRVVFSQERQKKDELVATVVCAEPSPDALTVLGASGGLSLTSAAGKATQLSGALSETGASIGLRTQSIQLLRDAMYRLCEGYAAGAVSEKDFSAMQRRYQSTMMGLIAIEQLTGPIVASQALLASNAAASAGAAAGDAAVDSAKSSADLAATAALDAESELDRSRAALDATREEMKPLDEQLRAEQAKKAAKKEFDQSVIDGLVERLGRLGTQERAQIDDVADKRRRLDDKRRKLAEAEADLRQAKAKVTAGAGGTGRLGDVAGATRASNEAFANAVKEIVTEINRSYSRDGCLALVTELIQKGFKPSGAPLVDNERVRSLEAGLAERKSKLGIFISMENEALDAVQRAEVTKEKSRIDMANVELDSVKRRREQVQRDVESLTAELQQALNAQAIGDPVLTAGMDVCRGILKLDLVASEKEKAASDSRTPSGASPGPNR